VEVTPMQCTPEDGVIAEGVPDTDANSKSVSVSSQISVKQLSSFTEAENMATLEMEMNTSENRTAFTASFTHSSASNSSTTSLTHTTHATHAMHAMHASNQRRSMSPISTDSSSDPTDINHGKRILRPLFSPTIDLSFDRNMVLAISVSSVDIDETNEQKQTIIEPTRKVVATPLSNNVSVDKFIQVMLENFIHTGDAGTIYQYLASDTNTGAEFIAESLKLCIGYGLNQCDFASTNQNCRISDSGHMQHFVHEDTKFAVTSVNHWLPDIDEINRLLHKLCHAQNRANSGVMNEPRSHYLEKYTDFESALMKSCLYLEELCMTHDHNVILILRRIFAQWIMDDMITFEGIFDGLSVTAIIANENSNQDGNEFEKIKFSKLFDLMYHTIKYLIVQIKQRPNRIMNKLKQSPIDFSSILPPALQANDPLIIQRLFHELGISEYQ
jgi:hypothetical protein